MALRVNLEKPISAHPAFNTVVIAKPGIRKHFAVPANTRIYLYFGYTRRTNKVRKAELTQ